MGELNPLAHEDSVNPLNISIDMSATAGVPQGGDNARGGVTSGKHFPQDSEIIF